MKAFVEEMTKNEFNAFPLSIRIFLAQSTDMRELFKEATDFDDDMSIWDASSVTNMDCMFRCTSSFHSKEVCLHGT